jgi:Holliday junction resolvasome RuvABC DNA-binding subunit
MYEAVIAQEITFAPDGVLLRAGHLVYFAECSNRDAERLAAQSGDQTVLCQVELTEEAQHMVVFASEERRKLYRALRKVSGIGRRSAILVLDCGEVIDTLRAVSGKDSTYFRGVPGMGPKRIEAVVAELEKAYKEAIPHPLPVPVMMWVEARDALMQQGLQVREAELKLRVGMEQATTLPKSSEELLIFAGEG